MAVATAVSRVTGFLRTVVLVTTLGLGTRLLDAYTAANATPNTVYELVMGGAVASVLVPLLARATADARVDDELYAQRLLSLVAYGLAAVTVLAVVAAPLVVDLCVPGFTPAQRHVTVVFTRFFMPQILCYGIGAAVSAVLNARGRFAAPMWAPVVNNLVVIAVLLGYVLVGGTTDLATLTVPQVLLLAGGTTAGVAAQMAVLVAAGRRAGFRLRLHLDPRGVGIRRIAAMAGWTLASAAAAQVMSVVATRIASGAGTGTVAAYANATVLFQMPYAVIAVTVITGALPRMSRAAARRDLARVTADLSHSLRLTGVVLIPVAAALVVLGPRLTTVLFGYGPSSSAAVGLTGTVLAVYGLALVPFAGYQIMLRAFYALADTRTPALVSTAVSALAVAGSLTAAVFVHGPRLVIALAAVTAGAYLLGLLVVAGLLRRRLGRVDGHRLAGAHGRMLAAAALAGLAAAATAHGSTALIGTAWGASVVTVGAAAAAGAGLYAVAGWGLRIREFAALARALRLGAT